MSVDGYSLSWGKLAGSIMKDYYSKGLPWYGNVYDKIVN